MASFLPKSPGQIQLTAARSMRDNTWAPSWLAAGSRDVCSLCKVFHLLPLITERRQREKRVVEMNCNSHPCMRLHFQIRGKKREKKIGPHTSLEQWADAPAGRRDAGQPRRSAVWCWRREEFGWFEISLAPVLVYSGQGLLLPYVPDWENKWGWIHA